MFALLLAQAVRIARQARAMRSLALIDDLTGIPNRRAILQALTERLATRQSLPVLIFDIDDFKRINDRLGHDVGDQVLRAVSRTVVERLGLMHASAQVGRIGGEEFLVLLPHGADLAAAAEDLRRAVESLSLADLAGNLRVTISLGGAVSRTDDADPIALLKRIDVPLYEAKASGRNRWVLAGPVPGQA